MQAQHMHTQMCKCTTHVRTYFTCAYSNIPRAHQTLTNTCIAGTHVNIDARICTHPQYTMLTPTCMYLPHMHTHGGQNCVRVEAGEGRAPWGPTHLPHVGTAECNTGAMRTESGMDSEREATQYWLVRLFLYLKGSESINAVPQTPASAPWSSVHSQRGARTDPTQGERSRGQGHTVGWAPGSVPSTCSTSSSFWPPTQH